MESFKKNITDFHYRKGFSPLYFLLFFPMCFYFLIVSIKNFLYEKKIFKEKKTKPFVICVGNLTTGGVGKTPVVIEIANYLSKKNKNVAVLSRGYGCKLDSKIVNVIKTYNETLIDDVELTGDEVNLISKNVEKAAVVICKDRVKGAQYAAEKLNADIVVMDDGFSHRKIYKDFNLILVDSEKMFGNKYCLPLGPLREPVSEIKRANAVIFVDKGGSENKELQNFKAHLKVPYVMSKMETETVYNIKTKETLDGRKIPIVAFSGIGSPSQFYSKLQDFELKETLSFSDHYVYTKKTVEDINNLIKKTNSAIAVTTEKDMVKLTGFDGIENIYALKLKPVINLDELFLEII